MAGVFEKLCFQMLSYLLKAIAWALNVLNLVSYLASYTYYYLLQMDLLYFFFQYLNN